MQIRFPGPVARRDGGLGTLEFFHASRAAKERANIRKHFAGIGRDGAVDRAGRSRIRALGERMRRPFRIAGGSNA